MIGDKRPTNGATLAATDRQRADGSSAKRRASFRALAKRLACVALLCLAVGGCSVIGGNSSHSRNPRASLTEPLTQRREKKSFGSWLFRRESTPSESIPDFMDMPRLDP